MTTTGGEQVALATRRRRCDLVRLPIATAGVVAAVLDALTTAIALGSGRAREVNPLGRAAFESLGLYPALVLRVVLGVVVMVLLYRLMGRAAAEGVTTRVQALRFLATARTPVLVATAIVAATWLVVVSNTWVIARL